MDEIDELRDRLPSTFVMATRQYLQWLDTMVDGLAGKRKREVVGA